MKINDRMLEYYSDSTLLTLMHDAEEKFKDLGWVEEKLTKGFKRLKKEVPTLFVPHFYAQIAALNQSVVVGDSILGFSIDKYMGADYPLYKRFYYDYQCRSMEPKFNKYMDYLLWVLFKFLEVHEKIYIFCGGSSMSVTLINRLCRRFEEYRCQYCRSCNRKDVYKRQQYEYVTMNSFSALQKMNTDYPCLLYTSRCV